MIEMTMRWYGPSDPIPLQHIKQIPGMTGIVTALYDLKPGEVWTVEAIEALNAPIQAAGLRFSVIESIWVHDAIKLDLPERDQHIEAYQQSIKNMAAVGVKTLCYNFMPVLDWMRTTLDMPLPDGSTALAYADADAQEIDIDNLPDDLPAWAASYTGAELAKIVDAFRELSEDDLFEHYAYFLKAVAPMADDFGVKMALHPDDPPWSIFGLPRIVKNAQDLRRILNVMDTPYHGLTFCTGSLGSNPKNDLPAMIREFEGRINFVHARNVRTTSDRTFHESEHPSRFGDVDMYAVMQALIETKFTGPIRPDHGRMIWGELGIAGYGLYDRALGAMYLQGLFEGLDRGWWSS